MFRSRGRLGRACENGRKQGNSCTEHAPPDFASAARTLDTWDGSAGLHDAACAHDRRIPEVELREMAPCGRRVEKNRNMSPFPTIFILFCRKKKDLIYV